MEGCDHKSIGILLADSGKLPWWRQRDISLWMKREGLRTKIICIAGSVL